MSLSRTSLVLIALCMGLLAAFFTFQFLARERARAARYARPVTVVVATMAIPARTIVSAVSVAEVERPAGQLPANCATTLDEVVGQVALSTLNVDEPIRRSKLASPSASLGLAYAVPDGMRAVAVALDPLIGVAGFLKPGDRVDVVATFEVNDAKVTRTVLQDVLLLAIGSSIRPEEEKRSAMERDARAKEQPNATLAVTPEQAEKLILAETDGKLRLTMRSAVDQHYVSLQGVRSDALTGIPPEKPARTSSTPPPAPVSSSLSPAPAPVPAPVTATNGTSAPRSDRHDVETIRGTERSTTAVDDR